MEWLKKKWKWLVGLVVAISAAVIWILTRRENGWAAEKILEVQASTEIKVQAEEDKSTENIKRLDDVWGKKRKKIVDDRNQKIAKIMVESASLDRAALKRKLLTDLDEPL